jgi:V/A-type H+-transporting ATPase subunit E
MGFEELISELQKQAEAEGKKVAAASEKNAGKIEEEAKEKAEEALRAAKKEASAYAKQESSERITSAKLSAKKIVDEARDDAVEASLKQVWSQFKSDSLRKGAYPPLLGRLISDGLRELGTTDAIIYVRDEDRQYVSGYRLSKLSQDYGGGVMLESANGKIRVNRTLEEVFAQKKGEIRKQIYDKLF